MKPFKDRAHAGQLLAQALASYAHLPGALILALPRGGVPVAYEVAVAWHLPLDVLVVRKLGVPGHEELAMGAITRGGLRVINQGVVRSEGISDEQMEEVVAHELAELTRREDTYRSSLPPLDVRGRSVILIDDGLATGATMLAAVRLLHKQEPARIIVAVPVAPPSTVSILRHEADDVICLEQPEPFFGVGMWYEHFAQTTDHEVCTLLAQARQDVTSGMPPPASGQGNETRPSCH